MKPDRFLIAMVFISVFVVGGVFILSDVEKNYEVDMGNDSFSDVFDAADEMYNLSTSTREDVVEGEIAASDAAWESMTKGGYKGLRKMLTTPFKTLGAIIQAIAIELAIPQMFVVATLVIMSITLVFAVIYMIFRFKP